MCAVLQFKVGKLLAKKQQAWIFVAEVASAPNSSISEGEMVALKVVLGLHAGCELSKRMYYRSKFLLKRRFGKFQLSGIC